MGEALFYHLTRSPLEETLPRLLERALAAGMRVELRGTDAGRMDRLDARLWLGPEDAFLPHGRAGGPHDADQPVLLTDRPGAAPGVADCLMAIDGAEVGTDEARACRRVCILFDGQDDAAVAGARAQWRRLAQGGVVLQYWSEASGRWSCERRHPPQG